MKKIKILFLVVLGVLLTTSCESDRDSNPTLQDPTEFVLNLPAYASTVYDLEHSNAVELTCSQPNYGFPAATTYEVQLSLTNSFTNAEGDEPDYVQLATTYSTARMNVDALEFAVAIVTLTGIASEEDFPTDPMPVYVRLRATAGAGLKPIVSNVIELPQVLAYYALPAVSMPENMYMIGSFNGWDWNNAYDMVPVHENPGKFWRVTYFESGAELKFNFNKSWDGGEFGYEGTEFPEPTLAGIGEKGGNILISNGGWYLVVVTTAIEGRDLKYTVELLEPNVYLTGDTSGGWDTFDEARLFTVPATADGDFISPAFVANGELRMCVKLDGIDWWRSEFIILKEKIEYRGTGNDQDRVSVTAGKKAYLNFTAGTGSIK